VNFWNYYIIKRFEEIREELGIKVVKVDEATPPRLVPRAGKPTKVGALNAVYSSVPAREGNKRGFERSNEHPT
jgi:hypothetical protein